MDIAVGRSQILRLENTLGFQSWMKELLRVVPSDDREDYIKQGNDLWVQFICFHKLGIYIRQGIKQENSQVPAGALMIETDEIIQREADKIKQQIRIELDIEEFEKEKK